MGAAKELWMMEIERISEDYFNSKLDKEEALDSLKRLGFDRHEAEDMLAEWAA